MLDHFPAHSWNNKLLLDLLILTVVCNNLLPFSAFLSPKMIKCRKLLSNKRGIFPSGVLQRIVLPFNKELGHHRVSLITGSCINNLLGKTSKRPFFKWGSVWIANKGGKAVFSSNETWNTGWMALSAGKASLYATYPIFSMIWKGPKMQGDSFIEDRGPKDFWV